MLRFIYTDARLAAQNLLRNKLKVGNGISCALADADSTVVFPLVDYAIANAAAFGVSNMNRRAGSPQDAAFTDNV